MMKIPNWIKNIYFRYFISLKKGKCLFIPHPGFCKNDKASIINYKADNCLIFVRYILDNDLYQDKELVVVSTTQECVQEEQDFCRKHYPNANIKIIPDISRPIKMAWASSEFILSSELIAPYKKKKGQKYFCLGYYPVSFKDEYKSHIVEKKYSMRSKYSLEYDGIMTSSLIDCQTHSSGNELPLSMYKNVGKCRTDVLLNQGNLKIVRDYIDLLCKGYRYSKIILYTPTHRDYEHASFDIKRSILGFNVSKERFEQFLKEKQLLIVCKLHPKQNDAIISSEIPDGVIFFKSHPAFGLIELMQVSDMLMTDYTSVYADYLLLSKPVVFNFYDLELYEKTRGLAFHPYERVCAGEKFYDEMSFYDAINNTLDNESKWAKDRVELLEHFNTYRDKVCENTYHLIFDEK